MKNKLTLNETIESFLNTDNKQVWDLILDDKIEELKELLPRQEADGDLDTIIKELFVEGQSETLDSSDFVAISDGNSLIMRELVRLIFALDINGNYDDLRTMVAESILNPIPEIVKTIQIESRGYPRNSINALVWNEGAGVRNVLNALIYYYKLKEDSFDELHYATMLRTQITLAIMGHYKNLVGPDMIEAAKIKEQMGETEAALAFYRAIETDFKTELKWFVESPESGPSEDDVIILGSLKEALVSIDRLTGSEEYFNVCAQIDEILSREHIEEPDFDDEDEE